MLDHRLVWLYPVYLCEDSHKLIYQSIVCRRSCVVEGQFPDSPEYLIELEPLRVLLKSKLGLK